MRAPSTTEPELHTTDSATTRIKPTKSQHMPTVEVAKHMPSEKRRKLDANAAAEKQQNKRQRNSVRKIAKAAANAVFEARNLDPEDGEAVMFAIQYTHSQVLRKDDAAQFIEAGSLEHAQLEAAKVWRPIGKDELKSTDEVLPCVVIYTRKRSGAYKGRCVVLGNLQRRNLPAEAANRVTLVEAAARSYFIKGFDISNAFCQAELGEDSRVFVRLPKQWSVDPRGDIVRLVKSLYGLRVSPRRWYDTYRAQLEKMSWEACPREPGLFRKKDDAGKDMFLSVYVDDSFIAGADESTVSRECEEILDVFPGKIIPSEDEGNGVLFWDIIGMSVRYNRSAQYLSISADRAVDKMLQKYNM
eukprot:gene281-193_t